MIGRDVYVAPAVVVVKTPYIHESDSSIWFYCKLVLSNAEKYPDKLDKLFTLQNIANLQGIGFTLDFGFKIYRDLTKSAPVQFGFTRCICLKTTK